MKIKNNKMNKVTELKIGSGEMLKVFEINIGFKTFKLTVRW